MSKQRSKSRFPQLRTALVALMLFIGVSSAAVVLPTSDAFADTTLCTDNSYATCINAGHTDHGYGANSGTSYWGMIAGHNCTNYVAYVLQNENAAQPVYGLHNASDWASNAAAQGVLVNQTPALGSVAQWNAGSNGAPSDGHVAYVEAIGADGSITTSDDAYPAGPFRWRVISPGSGGWPSNFIHFDDVISSGSGGGFTPGVTRADGGNLEWHLRNSNSGGSANYTFDYGLTTDKPVAGDWDGDGDTTPGIVRSDGAGHWQWHLRNSNSGGSANYTFIYGLTTDIPVVGDWDGDGDTTPGIVRRNGAGWEWHLRNSNSSGSANVSFAFGVYATDTPVVGDWDGDNDTTIGVYREDGAGWHWYLRNTNSAGTASADFIYGLSATDRPIAGDWDGDADTTPGVVRADGAGHWEWHLRNSNSGGSANSTFAYGYTTDKQIVGNWDGQ